jgi:hypothetical protein
MIVCIFEHVQWRWARNDRLARATGHLPDGRPGRHVGLHVPPNVQQAPDPALDRQPPRRAHRPALQFLGASNQFSRRMVDLESQCFARLDLMSYVAMQ